MKTNKQISEDLTHAMIDLRSGKISVKEAKAILTESAKLQKELKKNLSEFYRCVKIAKNNGHKMAELKEGDFVLRGIPAKFKHFYFEAGTEPPHTFNLDNEEFIVVLKDDESRLEW